MQSQKITCVELFSGCGGLAVGLAQAGVSHLALCEFNACACKTLNANIPSHDPSTAIYAQDVRTVDWSAYAGKARILAGGPPCQPFSIGGKAKGSLDPRDMWPASAECLRQLAPDAFLFENVKGLARPAFAEYFETIRIMLGWPGLRPDPALAGQAALDDLRSRASAAPAAYRVSSFLANAADFGAAQKRHRIFLFGVRAGAPAQSAPPLPSATHSFEALVWDKWVTGDYWRRHGLRRPSFVPPDEERCANKLQAAGSRPTLLPWVTLRDAIAGLGEPSAKPCASRHEARLGAKIYPGHTGSALDLPAKALKAGNHGVPGGENMLVGDDGKPRYFTVREAARLQGLPDSWLIEGSWSEAMRQLGNAVPVPLAKAMAGHLLGQAFKNGA